MPVTTQYLKKIAPPLRYCTCALLVYPATLLGEADEAVLQYFILVVALLLDPAAVLLLLASARARRLNMSALPAPSPTRRGPPVPYQARRPHHGRKMRLPVTPESAAARKRALRWR